MEGPHVPAPPTRGFHPQSISDTLYDGNSRFVNARDLVLSFVFDLSVSVGVLVLVFYRWLVRNKLHV